MLTYDAETSARALLQKLIIKPITLLYMVEVAANQDHVTSDMFESEYQYESESFAFRLVHKLIYCAFTAFSHQLE